MQRLLTLTLGLCLASASASAATITPFPSPDLSAPEVDLEVSLGTVGDFIRGGDAPARIDLENTIDGVNGVQRSSGVARASGGSNPTAAAEGLTFVESFSGLGTFGSFASVSSSLSYVVGIEASGLSGPFTVPVLVSGFVEARATAGTPTDIVFSGRNDAEAGASATARQGDTNSNGGGTLVFDADGNITGSEQRVAYAFEDGFGSTTRDPGGRVAFEIETVFQCVDGNDCSALEILLMASTTGQSSIPLPINGGPTLGDKLGTSAFAIADPVFTITDPNLVPFVNILVHPNVLIEDPAVVPLPASLLLLCGALGLLAARDNGTKVHT